MILAQVQVEIRVSLQVQLLVPLQVQVRALILAHVHVHVQHPAQTPVLVELLALPFDWTLMQRLYSFALHQ